MKQIERKLFFWKVVVILFIGNIILAGFLEYKVLFVAPDIFVLQSKVDGVNDQIVKTNSNLGRYEVVFLAPNIQNFDNTKNYLLVTTGQPNQESTLNLFNIAKKQSQILDLKSKYIRKIESGQEDFVLMAEDIIEENGEPKRSYNSKLIVVSEQSKNYKEINPQSFAFRVENIFVNPTGDLLVFEGFSGLKYLVDLKNTSSISQLKVTNSEFVMGFINQSEIHSVDYSLDGEVRIKIQNVVTDRIRYLSMKDKTFSQIVVDKDAEQIYYSQIKNLTNSQYKTLNNYKDSSLSYNQDLGFENINLSPKGSFLVFEKPLLSDSQKNFYYTDEIIQKKYYIFNLKTKTPSNDGIMGTKFSWVK